MAKKRGFTLMEVLISIGIIGILAAILMRVLSGVAPDLDKANFLRAYVSTRAVVADMINDSSIYEQEPNENGDYKGFADTSAPKYGIYYREDGSISGDDKFPIIFRDKLGLDGSYSARDGVYYNIDGFEITITTKAGKTLGVFTVGTQGEVSCESDLEYCEGDITNLKRKM